MWPNLQFPAENPTCADLILTNSPRNFQNSSVFETGLSDFHKLTITVLKQYFPKLKPKGVNYRDYQNFQNNEFRAKVDNEMLKHDLGNTEYQHSVNIFIEILNKHAPTKGDLSQKIFIRQLWNVLDLGISFYVIGQIFPEKNTKSKEIFVLASWSKLKKIISQILI